jgi:hypothetical protein
MSHTQYTHSNEHKPSNAIETRTRCKSESDIIKTCLELEVEESLRVD